MNQDGASNGITAPNGAAQERLILDTYRRFGIEAGQIGYVEAHGTGTRLGDPVETNALVRAFGRDSGGRAGWCALGSAKSHVGHAAAAAGAGSRRSRRRRVEREAADAGTGRGGLVPGAPRGTRRRPGARVRRGDRAVAQEPARPRTQAPGVWPAFAYWLYPRRVS